MAENERTSIGGSERTGPEHEPVGAVDPKDTTTVTVYLRERPGAGTLPEPSVSDGRHLSREEFAAAHGASEADVEAIRRFATEHGLTVGSVDLARRSVELQGSLGAFSNAFGTQLSLYRHPTAGVYRGRSGPLSVPASVAPIVSAVLGLDERPQATPHFRAHSKASGGYTPVQVAQLYDFPTGLNGQGECVAIIELGGGFRQADLKAYFSNLGLSEPTVTAVGVDGGASSPGAANGPDGEVMLDIEVVGAVAPGASIAVYFAPNTDQGFIDAVSNAAHDTQNRPSVISISWGGPENSWTAQAMTQMEQVFAAAAAMGVTVTVASGDNGSTDGQTDGLQHVDFPASAPHALACGGTKLVGTGAKISIEEVWNDGGSGGATGGGISDVFSVPTYQQQASVPPSANPDHRVGRGVPDVCGDADPATGYEIRVDGQTMVIGGTSAVAPLWAGLIALMNQSLGKPMGFVQPMLYSGALKAALHDIVTGGNGAYQASTGWDPCTGLGSPDGNRLLQVVGSTSHTGG